MGPSFTATELLNLVYRFYPRGLDSSDPHYERTEEARRLHSLRQAAQEDSSAWSDFLRRIEDELPECVIWEIPTLLYDACRCVRVSLPDSPVGAPVQKALVLLVSLLAPVHHIHASSQQFEGKQLVEKQLWYPPLPTEYQSHESTLDALTRSALKTTRLPGDILFTPVPDVQIGHLEPGEAKLIHCLFTDRLW